MPDHRQVRGAGEDLRPCIPLLTRGQRLFVATGKPWGNALETFRLTRELGPQWSIKAGCRREDMIVLILATAPRLVLGVTRARHDHRRGEPLTIDPDHTTLFDHGLSVNAVENRLGYRLRGGSLHEDGDANGIVGVLNLELGDPHPWYTPPTAPDDDPLPSLEDVWQLDSTSIIGRNDPDGGGFSTRVVLYTPVEPDQMVMILAAIVTDTFSGDLEAALGVLIDDHECWELLHPQAGIDTESCRVLRGRDMHSDIATTTVFGVGISLNGVSYFDRPGNSRVGDEAHGEAAWGYFFDPDGSITVLQTDGDIPVWQPWGVYTPDETGLHPKG